MLRVFAAASKDPSIPSIYADPFGQEIDFFINNSYQ